MKTGGWRPCRGGFLDHRRDTAWMWLGPAGREEGASLVTLQSDEAHLAAMPGADHQRP
jgi:hypothetical protein